MDKGHILVVLELEVLVHILGVLVLEALVHILVVLECTLVDKPGQIIIQMFCTQIIRTAWVGMGNPH